MRPPTNDCRSLQTCAAAEARSDPSVVAMLDMRAYWQTKR